MFRGPLVVNLHDKFIYQSPVLFLDPFEHDAFGTFHVNFYQRDAFQTRSFRSLSKVSSPGI